MAVWVARPAHQVMAMPPTLPTIQAHRHAGLFQCFRIEVRERRGDDERLMVGTEGRPSHRDVACGKASWEVRKEAKRGETEERRERGGRHEWGR